MSSLVGGLRLLLELAILAVAGACAAAALGAQGGRWNDRLDLLTHFSPLWLAGGLASLLLAIIVQRGWLRILAAALALAAVVSAWTIMAMDLTRLGDAHGYTPPSGAPTLKLIEFNVWARNRDPAAVARWLAREKPDVAILIEPPFNLEREIALRTGMHTVQGSGALIATRVKPVSVHYAWDMRELPGAPTEITWVKLMAPDGQPFAVFGVHCGWPIPSRYAWGQDHKIAQVLGVEDRFRSILAGDFNSTQWSFRQRAADAAFGLERRDRAHLTWPAQMRNGAAFPAPFLSIDHVYAGGAWRTVKLERGPRLGSDHYPLIATLAWAPR